MTMQTTTPSQPSDAGSSNGRKRKRPLSSAEKRPSESSAAAAGNGAAAHAPAPATSPNFETRVPRDCRLRAMAYLRPHELYGRYALTSRQLHEDSLCPWLPQARWGEVFCGFEALEDFLRRTAHPSFKNAFRPSGTRRRLKMLGHATIRRPVDASYEELAALASAAVLPGVTSLDLSLPPSSSARDDADRMMPRSVSWALSMMFPSLCEIDLTNLCSGSITEENMITELAAFRHDTTPNLQVVRWNNRVGGCHFLCRGNDLKTLQNLRELYLDGIVADCRYEGSFDSITYRFLMESSDYGTERHILLRCNRNLERVSLVGAQYFHVESRELRPFPQAALVKFVRATPKLKWFRSSLTPANVRMLQKKRPGIIFEG